MTSKMKQLLDNRIRFIRILTSFSLFVGIVMSFNLWISDRTFPLCPVSDFIPASPVGMDVFIVGLALLLLGGGMISKHRMIFISLIVVFLLLFLQDQMRWQPWAYMYFLMLIPFSFKLDNEKLISYFQILIIGVYLWGGIHKFSADFIDNTYLTILMDMFGLDSPETIQSLGWLGYSIPIIELAIALLLIFPRTRFLGFVGVVITHLFILVFLVCIDSNTILYPWNIAMVLFTGLLFYKNSEPMRIWERQSNLLRVFNFKAILLFILLPALSLFNNWDNYLSFKLFSGKTHLFYICIDNAHAHLIDPSLKPYYWEPEGLNNGVMISLNEWTLDELDIPFYPETRVFKKVASSFCETNSNPEIYIFTEFDRGFKEGPLEVFRCEDF